MATVTKEALESREAQGGRGRELRATYHVMDAADETTALAALAATAPLTWDLNDGLLPLARDNYRISPTERPNCYTGEANYITSSAKASKEPPSVNSKRMSFSMTGGSQHITQSWATRHKYAPEGKTAPDQKGAIGVTDDAVEGCDIVVPDLVLETTKIVPANELTDEYLVTVFMLVGTTNDDEYRAFPKGTLLFLGTDGTIRDDGNWDVTYRFQFKQNMTNQTIGDIDGIEYEGWNYVWILYEPVEDGDAKKVARRPAAVYVEKVYYDGDFELLGSIW